ncbi:unnamed protein product [Heterobilharzia americana]|nr:unnamed protein product [Heterobilharzia americana]
MKLLNIEQLLILFLHLVSWSKCLGNTILLATESERYQQQLQRPIEYYADSSLLQQSNGLMGGEYYYYHVEPYTGSIEGEIVTPTEYHPEIEYQAYNDVSGVHYVPVVYDNKYVSYVDGNNEQPSYTPQEYVVEYSQQYPTHQYETYTPAQYEVVSSVDYPSQSYERYTPNVYGTESVEYHPGNKQKEYGPEVVEVKDTEYYSDYAHQKYTPKEYKVEGVEYYPNYAHETYTPDQYEVKRIDSYAIHKPQKYQRRDINNYNIYHQRRIPYNMRTSLSNRDYSYDDYAEEKYSQNEQVPDYYNLPLASNKHETYTPDQYEVKRVDSYAIHRPQKYQRRDINNYNIYHQRRIPYNMRTSLSNPKGNGDYSYDDYAEEKDSQNEQVPDYYKLSLASNKHQKYIPNKVNNLYDYLPIDDKLYVFYPIDMKESQYKAKKIYANPYDYIPQPSIRVTAEKKKNGRFKNLFPKTFQRYRQLKYENIYKSDNYQQNYLYQRNTPSKYYSEHSKPFYNSETHKVKYKPVSSYNPSIGYKTQSNYNHDKESYNNNNNNNNNVNINNYYAQKYHAPKRFSHNGGYSDLLHYSLLDFGSSEKTTDYEEFISYHHSGHQGPKGKLKNYSCYDIYSRMKHSDRSRVGREIRKPKDRINNYEYNGCHPHGVKYKRDSSNRYPNDYRYTEEQRSKLNKHYADNGYHVRQQYE